MRADRPISLRLQLALIFAAGSLATLLVATGFLYWAFQREINLRNRQLLDGKLQEIAEILARHPDGSTALEEEILGEAPAATGSAIWLRVQNGATLVLESPGMTERLPSSWFRGPAKTKRAHRRYLLASRTSGDHTIQGALDITEDERMIFSSRRRLIYTLLLGTVSCAAFGAWAAHRGLRSLRRIAESTRSITAHRRQDRLDPEGVPSELRELVLAMNAMLDRLDHAFERLSHFSADLAHELRTPITNLLGETEVTLARERDPEEYRRVMESSLEELRRLSRLISRMLFLARTEDPRASIEPAPVEAARLTEEVRAFFEAATEEKGVRLTCEAEGSFRGDADLLRQALANLVSNALEATPEGGRIHLRALGSRGLLQVEDSGRGIAPHELPHLLDRFFRTREAQEHKLPGMGLGLAIVQSIARLHGGEVSITSDTDRGTTVTVRMPV